MTIIKSILNTLWVSAIELFFAVIALILDKVIGLHNFQLPISTIGGFAFLAIGLFFRIWAGSVFYKNVLRITSIKPQEKIVTGGPYRFTRNPLYIGIICIGIGLVLIMGSPLGVVGIATISLFINYWLLNYEEKDLEKTMGQEYLDYKKRVPRWF